MRTINQNIQEVKNSASMELMQKAKEMREIGVPVIDLAGGEPDFDTPDIITSAAIEALQKGHTHYAVGKGIVPLREAISIQAKENNIKCSIEDVIVTPGAKYAIYMAVATLITQGDEVLILSPYWVSYEAIVRLCGGIPKIVELDYKNNYTIDEKKINDAVTDLTKLLIVNYPNNPTGRILHKEECEILKRFVLKNEIYILSDEIYKDIIFDGKKSISIASVSEISDYVITVNGFSKNLAMTGWRVGYIIANADLTNKMYKLFAHSITGVSTFIQEACVHAFECSHCIDQMKKEYERRRNYLVEEIRKIPRLYCENPEGAFYIWVRVNTVKSAREISNYLLESIGLVVVPGDAYGENNAVYLRCSFGNSMDILKKAIEGLQRITLI